MALKINRTYGAINYSKEKKRWIITQADPHVCIKLKSIFPTIGRSSSLPYSLSDSPSFCYDVIWFMDRYPLSIDAADQKRLIQGKKSHINTVNELERILLPDYKPTVVSLKDGCAGRNYQIQGKDIALKAKRILVGDDIGLGKTLIAILLLLHPETLPALVVVQTHLPKQWKDQIERFTNLKVHIIKTTKPYDLPVADVYITKYSCLRGWMPVFETGVFKTAIFDEIQELRRCESEKYRGAELLSAKAEYAIGLSASPIYNYGDEIYNVINIINPLALGTRMEFEREWCNHYGTSVTDPKALGTYLREKFLMIRRTRADVGRELPPINKIVHYVPYDEAVAEKAEEIAIKLAIRVTSGSFTDRGQAARELDILLRKTTGVAKAHGVAEYVKILLENGEPVLLAGWHRDVYDIWMEELKEYKPVLYTGSESPVQKEKTKQAFINGESNLMIISLRSGIGLDGLQHRCKYVVFGELDWSPKVHDQVIGRVDRDGQKDQVTAIFLVTDSGSDPLIIDMLGIKASQSHNIINPLTAVEDQYTDESRIKLLAQRFLDKNKKGITHEQTY
jgi:SNF2 family DNA or RNA helicase